MDGCWGFTGSVPLPLWISVECYSVVARIRPCAVKIVKYPCVAGGVGHARRSASSRATLRAVGLRAIVVQPEEVDHGGDIARSLHGARDDAGESRRVGVRPPRGDQVVAERPREREIGLAGDVKMPQFAPPGAGWGGRG